MYIVTPCLKIQKKEQKKEKKLGMVVYAFNLSLWEAETGGCL